jgi:hypothetical protein
MAFVLTVVYPNDTYMVTAIEETIDKTNLEGNGMLTI